MKSYSCIENCKGKRAEKKVHRCKKEDQGDILNKKHRGKRSGRVREGEKTSEGHFLEMREASERGKTGRKEQKDVGEPVGLESSRKQKKTDWSIQVPPGE